MGGKPMTPTPAEIQAIIARARTAEGQYNVNQGLIRVHTDQLPKLGAGYYWNQVDDPEFGAVLAPSKTPYSGLVTVSPNQIRDAFDVTERNKVVISSGAFLAGAGPTVAPGSGEYYRAFGAPEDFIRKVNSPEYKAQYASAAGASGAGPEQMARAKAASEAATQAERAGYSASESEKSQRIAIRNVTDEQAEVKAQQKEAAVQAARPPEVIKAPEVKAQSGDVVESDQAAVDFEAKHIKMADNKYLLISDWNQIPENYQHIGLTDGADAMNAAIESDNQAKTDALKKLEPYKTMRGEYPKGGAPFESYDTAPYDIREARSNGVDRETLNTAFGQKVVDKALESRPVTLTDAIDRFPGRPSQSDFVAQYYKDKGWGEAPTRGTVRNDQAVARLNEAENTYLRKYPPPQLSDFQAAALFDAGIDETVFGSTDTRTMTEGQRKSLTGYDSTIKQATLDYLAKYGVGPIVQQSVQNVIDAFTGYKTLTNPDAPTYAKVIVGALDLLIIATIVGRPVGAAASKVLSRVFSDETLGAIKSSPSVRAFGRVVTSESGEVSLNPFSKAGKEAFQRALVEKAAANEAAYKAGAERAIQQTEKMATGAKASSTVKTDVLPMTRAEDAAHWNEVYKQINADFKRLRTEKPPAPRPSQTYVSSSEDALRQPHRTPSEVRAAQIEASARETARINARDAAQSLVNQARMNEARYIAAATIAIQRMRDMLPNKAIQEAAKLDAGVLNAAISQSPETLAKAYTKADPATQAKIDTKLSAAVSDALAQGNATKAAALAKADTHSEAATRAIASTKSSTKAEVKGATKTETQGQTQGQTKAEAATKAIAATHALSQTKPQTKLVQTTKPFTGIQPATRQPPKPPVKPPPEKEQPPERGKRSPKRPRGKSTPAETEALIARAERDGAVTWKQGKFHGKPMYKLWVYPYGQKDFTTIDHVPKGANLVSGKGSAAKTAKVLIGKAPDSPKTVDIGAFLTTVSPADRTGKKIRLSFRPDPSNKPRQVESYHPVPQKPLETHRSASAGQIRLVKVHDDGDKTVRINNTLHVLTTDGKLFKEVRRPVRIVQPHSPARPRQGPQYSARKVGRQIYTNIGGHTAVSRHRIGQRRRR